MGDAFLLACALVLVIEGSMPFISPARWRQVFQQVLQLSDGQIRFIGLCSIVVGLLALMFLGGD
ncbi:MAG: DUF2065 domain-containing protein [Burkholderiales bacterium]|jgi:uncharacterized protein YjeT (DUF2065 family)|nr:DUF2065 domain-containing protein [Burkholderiales bacterium]MBP7519446.1 DUF2065 domain-containing protein [Leptothrix sp. (in: b-proteobacteria)]HQY08191.1 DUF2065 domain-containing protein [Burkholderiaceae bacterium]